MKSWRRNKEKLHSLPISEKQSFLQTLSKLLDSHIPKDLAQQLYLSISDLTDLYKEGVEIGGHGYSHRRLAEISDEELECETVKTLGMLERIGISNPELFCYPDGSYSARVKEHLIQQKFSAACSKF